MKTPIAHNLKISDLLDALKDIPKDCKYVDAIVADELTLKFRPSKFQGEDDEPPLSDTDIEQLIG